MTENETKLEILEIKDQMFKILDFVLYLHKQNNLHETAGM